MAIKLSGAAENPGSSVRARNVASVRELEYVLQTAVPYSE